MPYTSEKPRNARDPRELRESIPGWGVDLDPKDRPAVPREQFDPGATGAHWEFPERQPERWPRERSPEHRMLTPVFGTSCPPRGLSGMIRRRAYRYGEGQTAHWMLLMLGDRIDVMESRVEALLSGRPDNPITETGIRGEFGHGPLASRFGQKRSDVAHQVLDPLMFVGTYAALGAGLFFAGKALFGGGADRR